MFIQNKDQSLTCQGELTFIPMNDDQYISQFLNIQPDQKNIKLKQEPQISDPNIPNESSPLDQSFQSDSVLSDSSVSFETKRSPLHNFQKHFVTTIRRSVNIEWPLEKGRYVELAKEMWEIFRHSKKYTKEFVSLIVGQSQGKIDFKLLKKYKLGECTSKYEEAEVRQAQNFIKTEVVNAFKKIKKQDIMYERRIGKKQQFLRYFYKLLSEIEQGAMNKRLPKRRGRGKKNKRRQEQIEI